MAAAAAATAARPHTCGTMIVEGDVQGNNTSECVPPCFARQYQKSFARKKASNTQLATVSKGVMPARVVHLLAEELASDEYDFLHSLDRERSTKLRV